MDKNQVYQILNKAYFSEEPHEKETLEHLPEILRSVRAFVDIGASLGQYTFHANKHIRGGHILAIEADPKRFGQLKNNCREWESLSNNKIQVLHAAISDMDGKTEFYITNSPVSGGLFRHDTSHVADELRQVLKWEEVIVNCFRLDTLFKDILRPDLVKIDVEGSELRVLKGCTRIMGEGKTRFLIEVHGWADPKGQKSATDVFTFMRSFGYYPSNLYGRYLFVKKSPPEVGLIWCSMQVKRLVKWMARRMLHVSVRHWLWVQLQRYGH